MTTTNAGTTHTASNEADTAEAIGFMGTAIRDFGGLAAVVLWALADDVGVLAALKPTPQSADVIAERAGADTRSVLEILRGLVAAGYVTAVGENGFSLPAAHAAVLRDGTLLSAAGGALEVVGIVRMWPEIVASCRTGSGIPAAAYPAQFADGMERLGAPGYDQALPHQWVTAVDRLAERLAAGARVADVGCGRGRALLGLAAAYPGVHGVGFDTHDASLEAAAEHAETAGLADRVQFRRMDATSGIPGTFDLVCAFDVLHDAGDPSGLATALRHATADDGVLLVLEPDSADDAKDNVGPVPALLHLFSVGYCLQVATHAGSARLGTAGLPQRALTELLNAAGYSVVRRLPIQAGLNACYEARP